MLHIITALYRPEYLKIIYDSIPKKDDICWHISKSEKTKKIDFEFTKDEPRIIVHEVDCLDTESWKKKQKALDSINDGYFCFLDDDTVFHENMYNQYKLASDKRELGMFIGAQTFWGNSVIRLIPHHPMIGKIDTGNVFCDFTSAKSVKFPEAKESFNSERDYQFWRDVYKHYNKKAKLISSVISVYNDIRKAHPLPGK